MLKYCWLLLLASCQTESTFQVIRAWKQLNFTWPGGIVPLADDTFVPENNLAAGIGFYDGWIYLTLPRMLKGMPVTLARVPYNDSNPSPLLQPYPSWDMNTVLDCDAIQNAQNIEIDSKGRIWIIDGGKTSTMRDPVIKCPPKLLVHDIALNKTILIYTFPSNVANTNSFLYDLVLDDFDGGYAYITDNSRVDPGIIVFDWANLKSWKVRHESMKAQKEAIMFTVDGINVTYPINIAGIAIGNTKSSEGKIVYYSPISSYHLYSVNASDLRRNKELRVNEIGHRNSQVDGMLMDNQDVLYFGLLGSSDLVKWDTKKSFLTGRTKIYDDSNHVLWPNSFTFDSNGNLLVLANRLHKYIYGRTDVDEENVKILSGYTGSNSYVYNEFSPTTTERPTTTTKATEENRIHFEMVAPNGTEVVNSTTEQVVMQKEVKAKSAGDAFTVSVTLLCLMVITPLLK